MKRATAARGQTLVLFSLTMLLTSVLVLLTLSIGTRVKEKMELQAVADAGAYSNAVITARAYNEIALMSRAQIGKMVSLAAVQSLISWSSYYRAQVEATRRSYALARLPYDILRLCCIPTSGCTQFCACANLARTQINLTRTQLLLHQLQLDAQWQNLDRAAGQQAENLHAATLVIYGGQLERYFRLRDKLNNQGVVRDIVDKAKAGSRWSGEWSAPPGADDVTMDEAVGIPIASGWGGAVLPYPLARNHHVYAAMGSRGWSFTTQRTLGGPVISLALMRIIADPRDNVLVTNTGSAYFATIPNHGGLFPSGEFSWAEDHADPIGSFANITRFGRGMAPCPPTTIGFSNAQTLLRSTDRGDATDLHIWSPGWRPDLEPPQQRHTLSQCIGIDCPGIWPPFVDYNDLQLVRGSNLWGQPKNYAVVQRDYSVRMQAPPDQRDPWTRFFNFDFTGSGGSGSSFDNRGIRLSPQNGGLDISRQTALSAGIAYYHRHGHWKEPPNLLNPYWRATLVPYDVDADGRTDVEDTLQSAGVDWAADAARGLRINGYKGGP
jgi:hypothetical protein